MYFNGHNHIFKRFIQQVSVWNSYFLWESLHSLYELHTKYSVVHFTFLIIYICEILVYNLHRYFNIFLSFHNSIQVKIFDIKCHVFCIWYRYHTIPIFLHLWYQQWYCLRLPGISLSLCLQWFTTYSFPFCLSWYHILPSGVSIFWRKIYYV